VPRKGAGHNSTTVSTLSEPICTETDLSEVKAIASASYIRYCLEEGIDCRHMMPSASWREISHARRHGTFASIRNLERIILYKLRTMTPETLETVAEVGAQGLAYRIYEARTATSLDDLLQRLATKRYPTARLRRILLHMLIGITQQDLQTMPSYGRILAFNNTGRTVLALSKGIRKLPFAESLKWLSTQSAAAQYCAETESRATDIYQLACNTIGTAGTDFRHKITLTNTVEG
jgi:hypothetical protein